MSRNCSITKKGSLSGRKVSHANNKCRKISRPNLQSKRIFDSETGKWVRLRVSTRVLRTINRKGLSATLRDEGLRLEDLR